jgi:hypothetical protein
MCLRRTHAVSCERQQLLLAKVVSHDRRWDARVEGQVVEADAHGEQLLLGEEVAFCVAVILAATAPKGRAPKGAWHTTAHECDRRWVLVHIHNHGMLSVLVFLLELFMLDCAKQAALCASGERFEEGIVLNKTRQILMHIVVFHFMFKAS